MAKKDTNGALVSKDHRDDFVGAPLPNTAAGSRGYDATPPAGLGGDSNRPGLAEGAAYRISATRVQDATGHFQPTHSTLLHAQNGDPNSMDAAAGRHKPFSNPGCSQCGAPGHGWCDYQTPSNAGPDRY